MFTGMVLSEQTAVEMLRWFWLEQRGQMVKLVQGALCGYITEGPVLTPAQENKDCEPSQEKESRHDPTEALWNQADQGKRLRF